MMHPARGLTLTRPVVRPFFGLFRPLEYLIGLGQMPFLATELLYLTPDHLLIVQRLGTQERYRRIYYEDIQGLRLQQARGHYLIAALLIVPVTLFLVMAILSSDNLRFAVAAGALAAFFATLLFNHLRLDAPCMLVVGTAVENVELRGAGRRAVGGRLFEQLTQRARDAQGPPALTPEEGAAEEAGVAPSLNIGAHALRTGQGTALAELPVIRWHVVFFALAVISSFFTMVHLVFEWDMPPFGVELANTLVFYGMIWFGALALLSQRNPMFERPLRACAEAIFLWQALGTSIYLYCQIMFSMMQGLDLRTFSFVFNVMDVCVDVIGAAGGALLLRDLGRRVQTERASR